MPALIAGLFLLALFFWIERRAMAPLLAIEMLARPSVRWGNLAALTIFSMEAGLVFLMTLYLQDILNFGPLTTGLVFGVPGLASATSDVADADAGLATGLVTTSQRVAVTVGIPLLGAVMLLRADLMAGIHLALAADVVLTLTVVAMISAGLKQPRTRTPG